MNAGTKTINARAWLGSLSAYNEGNLLGEWFEWDEIPESPKEWVEAMIAKGAFPSSTLAMIERATPVGRLVRIEELAERHEEIVAFDSEGYEWTGATEPDLFTLAKANEVLQALQEAHVDLGMWPIFLDALGADPFDADSVGRFQEAFQGVWDDPAEYVQNWHEECGTDLGSLAQYIDWEEIVRDWESEGLTVEYLGSGEYAIFRE